MRDDNISIKINKKCLINNTKDLVSLIKLPNYPLTEQFGKFNKKFPNFNQELLISKSSGHVQLKYILDQNFLYSPKNYIYKTSPSHKKNNALNFFKDFIKKNHRGKLRSVLDIGGNDSSIINSVSNKNTKKYVIDPMGNKKKGDKIIIIRKFLEHVNLSKDIMSPDLVICRHTLEHIPKPLMFIKKLLEECNDNCKFIFEVPSLERMIELQRFDTIMHQHISYFSVETLKMLVEKCGAKMKSYEIFKDGSCGGSIIFCFQKIIKVEKRKIKIKNFKNQYKSIKQSIDNFKINMNLLKRLIERSDDKLIGYGAGLMLATFFYFLKINQNKIKYIIDDDNSKHGWEYKNLKIKIIGSKKTKIKPGDNYLVTSLENKKVLISKILSLKPNQIFFPLPA